MTVFSAGISCTGVSPGIFFVVFYGKRGDITAAGYKDRNRKSRGPADGLLLSGDMVIV